MTLNITMFTFFSTLKYGLKFKSFALVGAFFLHVKIFTSPTTFWPCSIEKDGKCLD
jgi:hypothetical protein